MYKHLPMSVVAYLHVCVSLSLSPSLSPSLPPSLPLSLSIFQRKVSDSGDMATVVKSVAEKYEQRTHAHTHTHTH